MPSFLSFEKRSQTIDRNYEPTKRFEYERIKKKLLDIEWLPFHVECGQCLKYSFVFIIGHSQRQMYARVCVFGATVFAHFHSFDNVVRNNQWFVSFVFRFSSNKWIIVLLLTDYQLALRTFTTHTKV